MALTARQVWEGMLTELSKVNAPSMLLQDFNYFFNKAINQYINKRYNIYDVNQQTTDDLRVLKATAFLDAVPIYDPRIKSIQSYGALVDIAKYSAGKTNLFGATYEVVLPDDYLHMLNCVCIYKMAKTHKCYDKGDYVNFAAKRLTADSWSVIVNDYYNRPLPERPYYYIHNVNNSDILPTNAPATDMYNEYKVATNGSEDNIHPSSRPNELVADKNGKNPEEEGYETTWENYSELYPAQSNFPRTITLTDITKKDNTRVISTVEREAAQRYGNASKVRCEIRYGRDSSVYQLEKVFIDYIKAPQTVRLTQEQVDLTEDTSQIMEFPDYVCQEIINELVTLVMENTADPRLQSHPIVTQSIANPVQQQAPQPQPQQRG